MKTFSLILFGLGISLIPAGSLAADDGALLVNEYLEITGWKPVAAVCQERALRTVKVEHPNAPAEGITHAIENFRSDFQQLTQDAVRIYVQKLSNDDLRAVIDFYKTSDGQGIARKHAEARLAAYQWNQEHSGEPAKNAMVLLQDSLTPSERNFLDAPSVQPAFGRLYEVESGLKVMNELEVFSRREIAIAGMIAKKYAESHARRDGECGTNRKWREAEAEARRQAEAQAKAAAERRHRLYGQIGAGLLGLGTVGLIFWRVRRTK